MVLKQIDWDMRDMGEKLIGSLMAETVGGFLEEYLPANIEDLSGAVAAFGGKYFMDTRSGETLDNVLWGIAYESVTNFAGDNFGDIFQK